MNTENDFATGPKYYGSSIWCDFQNNSICGTPIAAPINSNGYVAYPASSWGAKVKVFPQKNVYIEVGAYEVNPSLFLASNGFKLGTDGAVGVATPLEIGVTQFLWPRRQLPRRRLLRQQRQPHRRRPGHSLPAREQPRPHRFAFEMRAGRYGGWVLADQSVQQDPGGQKGTVLFSAFEWGDRATALITWYGEGGVVRTGTFPGATPIPSPSASPSPASTANCSASKKPTTHRPPRRK